MALMPTVPSLLQIRFGVQTSTSCKFPFRSGQSTNVLPLLLNEDVLVSF